jgi:MFS family permease
VRRFVPYLALETATVLSGTAGGITMVAFPWLVLKVTGSATATGTISAVTAVPLLAAVLFSGTLVDMAGRRRISVASDVFSMLSVALVPVLAATVGFDFGLLLLVAALGSMFDPAGVAAREAMLPEAAAAARLSLERANGVHEAAYGLAFMLGPGVGGLLIAGVGVTSTFWATAAAFALSALVMLVTRIPGGGRPPAHARPRGVWTSTREGFAFLWRDPVLRAVALLSAALVALWLPLEGVVLPYHYNAQHAPGQLGWLVTVMSAGGVVGALLYTAVATRVRRHIAFTVALLGTSIPVLGMAFLPPYPAMLAFGFATGLFFGPINPITNIAMQERTPAVLRGRVVGAIGGAAYAAGPLGYLAAGPLVEGLGVPTTLLVLGAALAVACAVGAALPALRGLDDRRMVPTMTHPDLDTLNPDQRLSEAKELARSRDRRADTDAECTDARTESPTIARHGQPPIPASVPHSS